MNAFCAGGKIFNPVLFGEVLAGLAASHLTNDFLFSKSYLK